VHMIQKHPVVTHPWDVGPVREKTGLTVLVGAGSRVSVGIVVLVKVGSIR